MYFFNGYKPEFFEKTNIEVNDFWKRSRSTEQPYQLIHLNKMTEIVGAHTPAIYLINNGEIFKRLDFRTLKEEEINDFFN